jgi:hypothetical protein
MDATYSEGPVWQAFGLTYAAYLVVPRRCLQSMPREWQQRLVDLMNEMHDALPSEALDGDYTVTLKVKGRFATDPMGEYRHTGPLPLSAPLDTARGVAGGQRA